MFYMFLAPGFEEVEALCPLDLLRRAGIDVTTVSVSGTDTVTSSHGITVAADAMAADTLPADAEGVILPGGMPGTLNLDASPAVQQALTDASGRGLLICAICAAPSVPGKRGMLRGRRAVCFPGWEDKLEGAVPGAARVCRDGNFITAVGMGAAVDFGLSIVRAVKGAQAAEKLAAAVLAPSGTEIAGGSDGI